MTNTSEIAAALGRLRAESQTPEERKALAKKAANARWAKHSKKRHTSGTSRRKKPSKS